MGSDSLSGRAKTHFLMPVLLVMVAAAANCRTFAVPRSNASAEMRRVVEIEKEFALASVQTGLKRSFLAYASPEAVIFRPKPMLAVPVLNQDPDDDGGIKLDWWPAMGAISRAGDLALSVGPWVLSNAKRKDAKPNYGYYATIWKKQPNDSWKFVIDGAGAVLDGKPTRQRGEPVLVLPVASEKRATTAQTALIEVRSTEASLAASSAHNARKAIASVLDDKAWLMGSRIEPAEGRFGWRPELERRPSKLALTYLGGDASSSGDLAYTYGLVNSLDPTSEWREASYLHVWQRQKGRWCLIFQGIKSRR
jgi:ketosteroid isomerase-like protein